jgi:hypothetical protein
MTKVPRTVLLGSAGLVALSLGSRAAAQPAPSGEHPRIWLDSATRSGLQAQAATPGGPVERAAKRCGAARQNPSEYSMGGWQGFEFVTTLSACLTSWVASGDTNDRDTAIKYWQVLLDDYQEVGDGLGGDDVVTHDTGYAMRTFAPYSALAYDWLHDAPGVTEELRAHARSRFHAWFTYYSSSGYLRDLPGANYHAGYVFAATLIAIAEAGEAGPAGDEHWATVRDVIWQRDLSPALAPGGVLDGGDWPEGWQYGSLSVLEHALAARAMRDSQVEVAGVAAWASSLPLRFAHGLTPATRQSFVGGDSDAATPYRKPDNGALLAAIAGPASEQARAWARKLNTELELSNENPLFDALALAANGASEALPASTPTNYLARGVGNWYVRGGWSPDTAWGVFQCARHLVDDHQYSNAGNWVLTRGSDDLVVDPSPYGSLSTLTGNAPAVDSASLPDGYSPSQGYWGEKSGLVWARQSGSGIATARCDYADQFQRSDVPSDVAGALRDFVMIPSEQGAAVVLIDRVATGAADRSLHLRVRTPASLSLSGDVATGTLGASGLGVRKVWASGGTSSVRNMPQASECPSSSHTCDVSKLPAGSEYRIDIAGPAAQAIHVVDAAAGASDAPAQLLSGPGYRGVLVERAAQRVAVIANDSMAQPAAALLGYRVAAAGGAVHVVVDAPSDAAGLSDVTAVREGADCKLEVRAHAAGASGIAGKPLVLRVKEDCTFGDDGTRAPLEPDTGAGGMAAGSAGAAGTPSGPNGAGGTSSTPLGSGGADGVATVRGSTTASCSMGRGRQRRLPLIALSVFGLWLVRRRRAQVRRS